MYLSGWFEVPPSLLVQVWQLLLKVEAHKKIPHLLDHPSQVGGGEGHLATYMHMYMHV